MVYTVLCPSEHISQGLCVMEALIQVFVTNVNLSKLIFFSFLKGMLVSFLPTNVVASPLNASH